MKKYICPRGRKLNFVPQVWNLFLQTSPKLKEIHSIYIPEMYSVKNNMIFYCVFDKAHWDKASENLLGLCKENKDHIKACYEKSMSIGEEIEERVNEVRNMDLADESKEGLLNIWREFRGLWMEHDAYNVPPWYVMGDEYSEYVRKQYPEITKEDFDILATPSEMPWTTREELDVLRNSPDAAKEMADKYYWIPYGYDGPTIWDVNYYAEQLKKQDEKRIAEIKDYYKKIDEKHKEFQEKTDDWILFRNLQLLNMMTDERKRFNFQIHIALDLIRDELERRYYENQVLRWVTLEEVLKFDDGDVAELAHARKNNDFSLVVRGLECEVLDKVKTDEILDFIITPGTGSVSGIVACKGKTVLVKGTARIILGTDDMDKMMQDDILVTSMTTPDFIVAMRKASAIITDEGGITCHAAIVSREMNKPCLIATKHASLVFQDGNTLELNMEDGVVRKIG